MRAGGVILDGEVRAEMLVNPGVGALVKEMKIEIRWRGEMMDRCFPGMVFSHCCSFLAVTPCAGLRNGRGKSGFREGIGT